MNPEVLHLFAWDVAYEISLEEVRRLLTGAGEGTLRPEKAAPRELAAERFLTLPLPEQEIGGLRIGAAAHLYSFGVVCVTLRYRVAASSMADLIAHHDPSLAGENVAALARRSLDSVLARIASRLHGHKINPERPEAYTVFRFSPEDLDLADSEPWIAARGREAAALLAAEVDAQRLSDAEVAETLRQRFSYYKDDLLVVDWDAALVVERGPAEDVLRVLELANLQLVEYRHYDAELDAVVTRAYDDLERFYRRPLRLFGASELMRDLRTIRVNLAEVAEEVDNSTKFIGDWHLARIYLGCATRFHLPAWKASVEEKLKTLDEIYNLAAGESSNRKMLVLEAIIVILFVVDLVVLGFVSIR
jgi:hypothetical protein